MNQYPPSPYPTAGADMYSYSNSSSYPIGQQDLNLDQYSMPSFDQFMQPYQAMNGQLALQNLSANPRLGNQMSQQGLAAQNQGLASKLAPMYAQSQMDMEMAKLQAALKQAQSKEEIARLYQQYQQQLGLQNNQSANNMTESRQQQLLGYGWGG